MAKLTAERLKSKTRHPLKETIDIKELVTMEAVSGTVNVKVGADVVTMKNLDKVYFPKEGYTKLDLIKYYYAVHKTIIPYLKDRPLILKRYPEGIAKEMFYQHDLKYAPKLIQTVRIPSENHGAREYALVSDAGDLLYLASIGTIAQNPMHARIDDRTMPDYFIFDLDPEAKATFEDVRFIALEVKKVLDKLGIKGYPKTSGSAGIHIYVPVKSQYTYDQIVEFAKGVAELVVRANPDRATIIRWVKQRNPKHIYVDYLQNLNGKSVASAYSVREKPGAPVSAPLQWTEVKKKITIQDFTIANMPARLKKKGDLFIDVLKKRQSLATAQKKLKKLLEAEI